MLANPSQSCFLGPGFVEQRRRINADAPADVGASLRQPASNPSQTLVNDTVVIATPRVTGDFEVSRLGLLIDVVIEANSQNAFGPIEKLCGLQATWGRHPGHVRCETLVQPALQGFGAHLQASAPRQIRDSHRLKTLLTSTVFQSGAQDLQGARVSVGHRP